jgi:hypothetical protein
MEKDIKKVAREIVHDEIKEYFDVIPECVLDQIIEKKINELLGLESDLAN